jgi:hypothetical protein
MLKKPTSKPAIIYNQDDLYDYAKLGGSVESLFAEEIASGNRVVVRQEPINAPAVTAYILESMDDFGRWKESRQKMRESLGKVLGEA